jgi:5'-methylthioadenosine phosphorylase
MSNTVLGIIGGSGVYDIDGLENAKWERVDSPWGVPSDELLFGSLGGVDMIFLPRHGRGHTYSPSTINYRANIDALKRSGATDLISVSACGSLREDLSPGTFVFADQFIDRTYTREKSFFGTGYVAHVSMAEPVCNKLKAALSAAAAQLQIRHVVDGTYLVMEGPQFSTLAESTLYRSWGCSVIGMTAMPEAQLAREAELPYALVAMVTDYDCWHQEHQHVNVEQVVRVMKENAERAHQLLAATAAKLGSQRQPSSRAIENALSGAIVTAAAHLDPITAERLSAIVVRSSTPD